MKRSARQVQGDQVVQRSQKEKKMKKDIDDDDTQTKNSNKRSEASRSLTRPGLKRQKNDSSSTKNDA